MVNSLISTLSLLLIGNIALCQMGEPQTPQYPNFQPVHGGTPTQGPNLPQYQQPGIPIMLGAHASEVERTANRNNPYYRAQGETRSQQQMYQDWLGAQMHDDPAYNPKLRNPNSKQSIRLTPNEKLRHVIASVPSKQSSEEYTSKEFASKTKPYTDALLLLKGMLSGKQKMSVAEAYFTMENAYGESYLSKKEFYEGLNQSCNFISYWMAQNNLDVKDNLAKHYAIQKFISERTYITLPKQSKDKELEMQTVMHDPYFYDFNNYTGEKDHRDFYVTKCMATGMGQCNSMTTLYLCIAEGMGAKAYLSRAPQHALVKYTDGGGTIHNYEPTSNWNITDKWYLDNLFVSRKAQQAGIFLTPYDEKQMVASCMLDLAFGYLRKFGAADGKFMMECVNTAKQYFPKNNNIDLYITYSNLYGNQLGKVMKANNLNRVEDATKIPEAKALYEKWKANEAIIEALGYNTDPPGLYEEMMKHYEFRGREQQKLHLDGKVKHSLFTVVAK